MTKRIEELLTQIQTAPGCRIKALAGQPQIEAHLRLPDDLREFYQLCGRLTLAENTNYALTIVSPDRCVSANPIILGEVATQLARVSAAKDISWSWYIIAGYGNGDYITIDLDAQRLGRCYDSFHETHGLVVDPRSWRGYISMMNMVDSLAKEVSHGKTQAL